MQEFINVKEEYLKASQIRTRHLLLFILATVLTLILVPTLMLTSKEKYLVNLIFTILISALYLVYLVFYLTVLRKSVVTNLHFYEGASTYELSELYVVIGDYLSETKSFNGNDYFLLEVQTVNGVDLHNKNLLINTDKIAFKKGEIVKATIYSGVVIKMEKVK